MAQCHTLIISDLHLGARICQTEKILAVLNDMKCKQLIINGDLFDSDTTQKFNGMHWRTISLISELSKKMNVVLVGGNHGRKLDILAEKMGLEVREDYAFTIDGKKFLCLHGDEFDLFIKNLPRTADLFTRMYYLIQHFDGKKQSFSMAIKRLTKEILGISRRQQRLALKRGRTHGAHVVICSHTHIPYSNEKDGLLFLNSGSFCNNPSSFIMIDKKGVAELREI